jgi:hypothetical protein
MIPVTSRRVTNEETSRLKGEPTLFEELLMCVSSHIRLMAVAVLAIATTPSLEAQGRLRGGMRLGGDMGGDKVLQFEYSDGSTPDVTAGGGLVVSANAALRLVETNRQALDAQLNLGWKYRTIPEASNQTASWSRFPFEAMLFYGTPFGLRIGGGATMHLGNALEASGDAVNDRVEFKTTPGYLAQVEYMFSPGFSLDLRYTVMKYEIDGSTDRVNANSIGIGMNAWFGHAAQQRPTTTR